MVTLFISGHGVTKIENKSVSESDVQKTRPIMARRILILTVQNKNDAQERWNVRISKVTHAN